METMFVRRAILARVDVGNSVTTVAFLVREHDGGCPRLALTDSFVHVEPESRAIVQNVVSKTRVESYGLNRVGWVAIE